MINAIGTALSGLNAASLRLNASASNIANVSTAGSLDDPSKAPYTPKTTQSKALSDPGGVATEIVNKQPAFIPAYNPDSPFANQDGLVGAPNVDLAEEAVTMKLAETAYKANVSVIKTAEDMFGELLETFDKDV